MKILFICKYNRFRSRVAEAYFKKINKNIKADSAGLFKGHALNEQEIKVAEECGLDIKGEPKSLGTDFLREQDLVIIVADDVPTNLFDKKYVKELITWNTKDAKESDTKAMEKTINTIKTKVEELNKKLK